LNVQSILSQFGIYAGTYVFCVISGFVPVVNAELFLIIVSSTISKELFFPVLILAAAGQMTAKSIMFLGGKGIIKISTQKYQGKIEQVHRKLAEWKSKTDIFIFLSAFTGFPPFYIVALAAGTVKINFLRFFIAGLAGRFLRFGLAMLFPQLFKEYIL